VDRLQARHAVHFVSRAAEGSRDDFVAPFVANELGYSPGGVA